MNHGSLFSGGGGFDLAAEIIGWNNTFHCERDPFCQTILKHYWPNSTLYGDIKKFDARKYRNKIDILTGGFPCQPFSAAGKRRGTEDDRYLWPEMLRIIREIRPRWVVGENVYGLISWNGGMVFEQVQADLEREGYAVRAFVLPAAGINAPHRRDRVWFVAYSTDPGRSAEGPTFDSRREEDIATYWNSLQSELGGHGCKEYAAITYKNKDREWTGAGTRAGSYWRDWPTQPSLCSGDDGIPTQLDGITVSKWRKESIKVFGNAIVPQVVLEIFKVIELMEGKS